MTTLGDKINSIEFSEVEKSRLSESIRSGETIHARVLKTKALGISDHLFWKGIQKQFQLKGFRDGVPSAREEVLKRAFDAFRKSNSVQKGAHWFLYRHCVRHYVIEDLPALNKILLNEEFEGTSGSLSEQIIRCLKRALPLYNATIGDVRQIYDLWGFDRIGIFEEMLDDLSIDSKVAKRLIANSASEIRREVKSELGSLSKRLGELTKERNDRADSIRSELASLSNSMNARLLELRSATEKAVCPPTERRATSSVSPRNQHESLRRAEDFIQAVNLLKTESEAQVEALTRRVKQQESKLAALSSTRERAKGAIRFDSRQAHSYPELLSHFSDLLREKGFKFQGKESISLLLNLLRSTRVVITDKEALPCSLFACIPDADIRLATVSPLWITSDSWSEHLSFISNEEPAPRVLVLIDFDVAIQETYLLPSILSWISQVRVSSHNRIVLVPSDSALSLVSDRILELGFVLTSNGEVVDEIQRSTVSSKFASASSSGQALPKDFLKCSPIANPTFEVDMQKVALNDGIRIPSRLLEHFVSVYSSLIQRFPDDVSGRIAAAGSLLPWVAQVRGQSVARIYQNSLTSIFGKS